MIQLTPEILRTAGLSRPKASYILDLAQKANDGLVPALDECDGMTDEEIVARLTAIKGIGLWTVKMLLIFNLGRPAVLPVHDLGLRKGFLIFHRKPKMAEPDALARQGKRWPPHRTAAALYQWRATDFLKSGEW